METLLNYWQCSAIATVYLLMILFFLYQVSTSINLSDAPYKSILEQEGKSWTYGETFILAYLNAYRKQSVIRDKMCELEDCFQRSSSSIRTKLWRLNKCVGLSKLDQRVLKDVEDLTQYDAELLVYEFCNQLDFEIEFTPNSLK